MGRNSFRGTARIDIGFNFIQYFFEWFFSCYQRFFSCYADYNTIYQSGRNTDAVMIDLRLSTEKLFRWLSDNQK